MTLLSSRTTSEGSTAWHTALPSRQEQLLAREVPFQWMLPRRSCWSSWCRLTRPWHRRLCLRGCWSGAGKTPWQWEFPVSCVSIPWPESLSKPLLIPSVHRSFTLDSSSRRLIQTWIFRPSLRSPDCPGGPRAQAKVVYLRHHFIPAWFPALSRSIFGPRNLQHTWERGKGENSVEAVPAGALGRVGSATCQGTGDGTTRELPHAELETQTASWDGADSSRSLPRSLLQGRRKPT